MKTLHRFTMVQADFTTLLRIIWKSLSAVWCVWYSWHAPWADGVIVSWHMHIMHIYCISQVKFKPVQLKNSVENHGQLDMDNLYKAFMTHSPHLRHSSLGLEVFLFKDTFHSYCLLLIGCLWQSQIFRNVIVSYSLFNLDLFTVCRIVMLGQENDIQRRLLQALHQVPINRRPLHSDFTPTSCAVDTSPPQLRRFSGYR